MNNYKKRTLTKLHRLYCLLTMLFICACTDVPEYCSDHNRLDPFTQFCYQGKTVNKCNGAEYNPSSQFCYQNRTIVSKCGGEEYDPSAQGCYGGIVRSDANVLTVNIEPTGGGTVSRSPNQTNYKWGTTVTATATAASGYKFTGWSDAATDTAKSVKVTMNGDKTLTANFQKDGGTQSAYFVYFNANGATKGDAPAAIQRSSAGAITLPDQASLIKDGYAFAGWNTAADGGGETYNAGNTYTVTSSVILYAQWSRNSHTLAITVSPSGSGTVSRNPDKETYQYGEQVTVKATPANNFIFYSWSGASSSTNAEITITMDGDKTLTAGFGARNAKRFTVYFNANGGGTAPATASADSGASITLPDQQTMDKSGYRFGGWNTKSNGTGTNYSDGDSYRVIADITLYAKWIPIYTITFSGNGATGGASPQTIKADSGSGVTMALQGTLSKIGHTFGGWNTKNDGTGTNYGAGQSSYIAKNNDTLYAKWIVINYSITYTLNGGTVSPANPLSYNIETATFTLTNPTRTGYTFGGWTGSNGAAAQMTVSIEKGSTGERSYTANWTAIYTVTFNGNGTTVGVPAAVTVNSGSSITLLSMTRDGYTFGGWNTNSSGTGTNYAVGVSYTFTGNVTLYAKWTAVSVVVDPTTGTFNYGSQSYKTVVIGGKRWMADNLNYQTASGSWCYGDNSSNCIIYGRLYTWEAAKTACPSGWKLPDTADWRMLVTATGGSSTAGIKLKNVTGWNSYSGIVNTNETGFSALPGGGRNTGGAFVNVGISGYWWTATERGCCNADSRGLYYNNDDVIEGYNDRRDGFSVRCVEGAALYAVTVSGGTGSGNYAAGATVSITAGAAPTGQVFKNWTVTSGDVTLANANSAATSFTMPAMAVTVTANWQTTSSGGGSYKTVTIGGKIWMAENLNIVTENSWCYNNSPDSCAKYGRLYTWDAAKTACPAGWHLPSRSEWGDLAKVAGGTGDYGTGGTAGTKLKSKSGWSSSGNGTDDYGFSALPGGDYYGSSFGTVGNNGYWWTATEFGSSYAYCRNMGYNYDGVGEGYDGGSRAVGFSVRCVGN